MTIARIIEGRDHQVISCESASSVRDAVAILAAKRIGALPVIDNGDVVGIFSERDALYQLAQTGPGMLDKPVREAMTSPAVTVSPDVAVLSALSLMTRRRIRHLPVIEGGKLVGFVSIGDLVKYRIDRIEAEADAMRNYIQTA